MDTENNELKEKREKYPRVSSILQKQMHNEMRDIPLERLYKASIRGTAVHNYCTAYIEKLFMPEIEAEYLPYVDAFIEWADEHVREVIQTRRRFYDDELKFSGEPDAILILKDSDVPTLIDIKATCATSKSWALQLGAYRHLCTKAGFNIGRVLNVHLKKTTKTKTEKIQGEKVRVSFPVICAKEVLPPIDFNKAWEIFNSALSCYDYFDRKEEKECSATNPP